VAATGQTFSQGALSQCWQSIVGNTTVFYHPQDYFLTVIKIAVDTQPVHIVITGYFTCTKQRNIVFCMTGYNTSAQALQTIHINTIPHFNPVVDDPDKESISVRKSPLFGAKSAGR
jgi:hypothetical protein